MENTLLVIGASGQTVSTQNGLNYISNGTFQIRPFSTYDVANLTKWVPVAETLQVTTVTPPDPSTTETYTLSISGRSQTTGNYRTWVFYYYAVAADTATTVCNGFRAQIASQVEIPVTTSGTATLILTGVSGITIFSCTGSSNFTSVTTGTAGVKAVGEGTLINDQSYIALMSYANETGNVIVDGSEYLVYTFDINRRNTAGGGLGGVSVLPENVVILVLSSNTTAESALDTMLGSNYES